jgi:hypothetical protein
MNPVTPKSNFVLQLYLASCVKQVPSGTPEAKGHRIVNVQSRVFDVDVAAAQSQSSAFATWLMRNVRQSQVGVSNVINVDAAVGNEELADEITAVGGVLGAWNIPDAAEAVGLKSRAATAAARVVAIARGDRVPHATLPARISAHGLELGGAH